MLTNFTIPDDDTSNSGEFNFDGVINQISGDTDKIIQNQNENTNKIVNQLSGDTQKVIDNQNQNTQALVNQLSGDTTRIINNTNENIDNIFDSSDLDDYSFDDFLTEASGDFKNPYDINSINESFLDGFDSSMEDDFIISWDNYSFTGLDGVAVNLIPSGEINFSALCRDNETLGSVKNYISLFCICSLGIKMLSVFYNLVLATLGIGSYFYANDDEDLNTNVYVDMDTGYTTTTYSGKSVDGSRYSTTYNHTKIKPHRRIGF